MKFHRSLRHMIKISSVASFGLIGLVACNPSSLDNAPIVSDAHDTTATLAAPAQKVSAIPQGAKNAKDLISAASDISKSMPGHPDWLYVQASETQLSMQAPEPGPLAEPSKLIVPFDQGKYTVSGLAKCDPQATSPVVLRICVRQPGGSEKQVFEKALPAGENAVLNQAVELEKSGSELAFYVQMAKKAKNNFNGHIFIDNLAVTKVDSKALVKP